MESSIKKRIELLLKDKKKQKIYLVFFVCLALLVTAGTVTALRINGRAKNYTKKVLVCALEVHRHESDCYNDTGELICGQADYVVHIHNSDCYDEEGMLVCQLPEIEAHEHNGYCYEAQDVLICTETESAGHQHGDSCYILEQGEQICDLEESEEHTHSEDCYNWEEILTCEMQEGEGGHTHSEDCYDKQVMFVCDKLELHIHDDNCYEIGEDEEQKILVCSEIVLEEHIHNSDCFEIVELTDEDFENPEEEPEEIEEPLVSCYNEQGELICGLTEHTHSEECFGEDGEQICELHEHTHIDISEEEEYRKEYEDDKIYVTAVYGPEANIPEEAVLRVRLITPESDPELYAQRESEFNAAMGGEGTSMEALLNIGFYLPEEDIEIEPEDKVTITLRLKDENGLITGDPIVVVHFVEEGSEILSGSDVDEDGATSFEVASFSDFGIATLSLEGQVQGELENETQYYIIAQSGSDYYALTCETPNVSGISNGTSVWQYLGATKVKEFDPKTGRVVIDPDRTYADEKLLWTFSQEKVTTGIIFKTTHTYDRLQSGRHWLFPTGKSSWQVNDLTNANQTCSVVIQWKPGTSSKDTVRQAAIQGGYWKYSSSRDNWGGYYLAFNDKDKYFFSGGSPKTDSRGNVKKDEAGTIPSNGYFYFVKYEEPKSQVPVGDVLKPAENSTVDFDHHKTIDYLGDNGVNPDTNQNDGDEYRLNLDITGKSIPTNLLIVVDRSGSMQFKIGSQDADQNVDPRDSRALQLAKVLNGPNGDDGLINQFLALNDQNRVAVTWFAGRVQRYYVDRNGNIKKYTSGNYAHYPEDPENYTFRDDAGLVLDWTGDQLKKDALSYETVAPGGSEPTMNIGGMNDNGTNYSAGLTYADYMLREIRKKNNNRIIVVFISDGVPTLYYTDETKDNYQKLTGWKVAAGSELELGYIDDSEGTSDTCAGKVEYNRQLGTGVSTGANKNLSYEASKKYFYTFKQRNPNISFYTIGIDLKNETKPLLQEMAAEYNEDGKGYRAASNYEELLNYMKSIIMPADVTITDQLSAYVEFLDDADIDVMVTARSNADPNAKETVLWKNDKPVNNSLGSGKNKEENIVKGVTLDRENSQISVEFRDDYALSWEYTYTLSFNVRLTQKAYDEYAEEKGEAYEITGDEGTDYGSNETSSNIPGFPSNNQAWADFTVGGVPSGTTYDDPVVQTWRPELKVIKKDEEGKPIKDVTFKLAKVDKDGNEIDAEFLTTDEKGEIYFSQLPTGDYTLQEFVVSDDYVKNEEIIRFSVSGGMIVQFGDLIENSDWSIGALPGWKWEPGNPDYPNASWVFTYSLSLINHVNVLPADLQIKKVDAGNTNQMLDGAEFKLVKVLEDGSDGEIVKLTSEGGGLFSVKDLPEGRYRLYETKAPNGYRGMTEPVEFVVTRKGEVEEVTGLTSSNSMEKLWSYDRENRLLVLLIPNDSGYVLPDAGGGGIYGFVISGLFLIEFALISLLYLNKKKSVS